MVKIILAYLYTVSFAQSNANFVLMLLYLLIRTKGSVTRDGGQADPKACKKGVHLLWIIMRFFPLIYAPCWKNVAFCINVASG